MPKVSRVHECVSELEGKPGVNAYAVCQSSTGQSYATGKPIRKTMSRPRVKCGMLKRRKSCANR